MSRENNQIYHEKQSRMLCAVHCLNNLFQNKGEFSKASLDQICVNLSPDVYINPHKSFLGLGNYDVNIIAVALQSKSMELVWFDRRKEITSTALELTRAYGYILNVPSDYSFGFVTLPIKSRHWICVRRLQEKFYNLDSKLDKPRCIGDETDFVNYLKNEMKSNDKELFIVFPKDAS